MPSTLSQAMTRIAELQKDALNTLTDGKVDAVAFFPYQQESFPYFVNWLSGDDVDEDISEDIVFDRYVVTMRLVVGHFTEGYEGETSLDIYEYIPAIKAAFATNPYLTSTASTTALDSIAADGVNITGSTGLRAFVNAGLNVTQIGVDFTLELPILRKEY